jgi:integrase
MHRNGVECCALWRPRRPSCAWQGAPQERNLGVADRVFLSPEGQPQREDTTNARRVLRRLLDAAGIERIEALGRKLDIHALRGTPATSPARRCVSIAVTPRLLGHQTADLTAKHYTRLEVEDVRAAIEGRTGPGAGREATA